MLDFMFATPKRHILGRNGVFWHILRQNPSRALGCSELQEPKKLTRFWCAKSRMRGDETPGWIVTNFCTGVGVHDVIKCADLYYDRLRGLGVAVGQILAFSIDLLRRPYNTLALPCECVIIKMSVDIFSLGEMGKKFNVEYLRNANPQYHGLARDYSPGRPLLGDDVIWPRPLPVCMQMRSKGKTLRSYISGTERARRKILSPHDHTPPPLLLLIPPYHLWLRFRVWGSEPPNPKFTFFDRNFLK